MAKCGTIQVTQLGFCGEFVAGLVAIVGLPFGVATHPLGEPATSPRGLFFEVFYAV